MSSATEGNQTKEKKNKMVDLNKNALNCFIKCSRSCSVASVMPDSLQSHGLPSGLLCPWDFSGENTGVGCHSLLWGNLPAQGLNLYLLCLLHCRQIPYCRATGEALH